MRLHEWVTEIHSIAADPDPKRIIAHAQHLLDCEAAFDILRKNGYGLPEMSIVDAVRVMLDMRE